MSRLPSASLVLPLFLCGGCLGPVKTLYPPAANQESRIVYVVSHGWHTGVIIPREHIPEGLWPAAADFDPARHVEAGWGDDGFYRAEKITLWISLKALFWPTPSVLHLVGVGDPLADFPASKLVQVELSRRGFERLCAHVSQTHEYSADGRALRLGSGLYGRESFFYQARGKYYLPKTCNYWTAQALRTAGCPITPIYCVTAGNVLFQTKRFGREVSRGRR